MSPAHAPARAAAAFVGLALLCSGLSACSHDASADAKKSATPSATETTIAPPEGDIWPYPTPTLPPEASRDDSAGACAVAAYYLESVPYDAAHLRTDAADRYADPRCERCKALQHDVREFRRRDGWMRNQHMIDLQLLSADPLATPVGWRCNFHGIQDEGSGWKRGDKAVEKVGRTESDITAYVVPDNGSWKILEIGDPEDVENH
ncbi:MAG: DUF6318 family protein [Actinomycetaceae bacterium]|nr:DUF6318 family protein [Actinomycetaceae bacterium]MDU0969885.1 DUF6318 family protein [Actinomycetaceae bacterium]